MSHSHSHSRPPSPAPHDCCAHEHAREAAQASRPAEARLRLRVAGMDCGSCARMIEEALRRLPGVRQASVDFTSETLEVEGEVSRATVEHRLRQLGYRVARGPAPDFLTGVASASIAGGSAARFARFLWPQPRLRAALVGAAAVLGALLLSVALRDVPARLLDVVCAATVLVIGWPIFTKGLRALVFSRRATVDLLMTLAAIGALLIGQAGEAAAVVLLFTLGEALEAYSAERARQSLRALLALQPLTANRLCAHGGGRGEAESGSGHEREERVAVVALEPGDRIIVRPGERIAADGVIARGVTSIDPSAVTGESLPVERGEGDEVSAGTINLSGAIEVRVKRAAADSTIARIASLVETAQARRSPAERLIDRFARLYTPAVMLLALAIVAVPVLVFGLPLLDAQGERGWLYRGLALLIVACPCALVISIPVTMVSALTRLARLGILVKGGEHLDRLADVRVVAFDKTGTLTRGRPSVAAVQGRDCAHPPEPPPACESCDEVIALAASVESGSEHPIAHAILESAGSRGLRHRYPRADAITARPGRGVVGRLGGKEIAVGSDALMRDQGAAAAAFAQDLHRSSRTVMLVARGREVLGAIGVEDDLRSDGGHALEALRAARPALRTVMLTGDNERVARSVVGRLGPLDELHAGLLPAQKLAAIETLQRARGPVVMIGDGINDAPALARADVGIAMGGAGTAQAMETADVVLMQDDLSRVPVALRIARRTRVLVKQNVALSLGLKLAFLALAIPGWATLWLAVAADVGATLLVTLNGMRALHAR